MAKKDIKKIDNLDVIQPRSVDTRRYIKREVQLYRVATDLKKYKLAVLAAENIQYPQRHQLYQIYNNCMLDAHLSAAIQQRKNLTLSKEFQVLNPDGEINEEKTKLINKKWFRDYLDLALDSLFWSHSLIQFDSIINDEFKCVELVPRIYVKPEFHIVTQNYSDLEGLDYLEMPYRNWCIGVGKSRDLGLLLKASPLVIWKKNAMGAWAEFIEKFGVPARIGKTNVRDAETRANMEDMLKNMGTALWAVLDTDDEIVPGFETKTQDAYNVFDMMIQRCNSEISKLILGQTMTLDDGSSKSQAEVHERVVEMVDYADEQFIKGVNNYQLCPMLTALGLFDGSEEIVTKSDDEWDLEAKGKFDVELLKTGKYKFTPEYLLEKYNTEVVEVEEQEVDNTSRVKKQIDNLYK